MIHSLTCSSSRPESDRGVSDTKYCPTGVDPLRTMIRRRRSRSCKKHRLLIIQLFVTLSNTSLNNIQ